MNYSDARYVVSIQSLHNRALRSAHIRQVTLKADQPRSLFHGMGRVPIDMRVVSSPGTRVEYVYWNHIPPNENYIYLTSNNDMTVDIYLRG